MNREARETATSEVGGAEDGVHGGDRGVTKIMIDRAIKFRCRTAGGGRISRSVKVQPVCPRSAGADAAV